MITSSTVGGGPNQLLLLASELKNNYQITIATPFDDFYLKKLNLLSLSDTLLIQRRSINLFDLFRIGKFATNPYEGISYIFILIGVIFYLPNTQDFIFNENKSSFNIENKFFNINKNIFIKWQPNALWGFIFALIADV